MAHLTVDREQRRFGALYQQDARRLESGGLARQLRTDRAAGAGDHYDLAAQEVIDSVQLRSEGSARSTSRMHDGSNRAAWRANSEPIEPPAPVTITTLPPRK